MELNPKTWVGNAEGDSKSNSIAPKAIGIEKMKKSNTTKANKDTLGDEEKEDTNTSQYLIKHKNIKTEIPGKKVAKGLSGSDGSW